jgi:hypothetical protein
MQPWYKKIHVGGNKIIEFGPLCELHASLMNCVYQENRNDRSYRDTFLWIGKL